MTSLTLCWKFLTAKKSTVQSMQAWIGHIQSLAFCMEEAGIEVADQDQILALTMGLPDSYNPVIINFDSTASELLTLNHIIAHLLNEEARQSSHAATTNEEDTCDEALAAVQKNRSRPHATGGNTSADIVCYLCDKKGHYKSECPQRKEWEKSKIKKYEVAAVVLESDSDDEYLGAF